LSGRVRASVEIAASVAEVFAYLDDPHRGLALMPDVIEVTSVEPLPNGGHRVRLKALGRGGRICDWVSETVERIPNDRVVVRAETERLTTTSARRFSETPRGTRLDAEVVYDVGMPALALPLKPVTELQLRKSFRLGLQALLARLKARIEAAQAP
jgi:hypothetical protein